MVPAMAPLTMSCGISPSGAIAASGHFEQHELSGSDLVVAELAVGDVADVGEVAGTARAFVVDVLALREQLQPFDGAVHLLAAALADLAHVVADARPGRGLRLRDRERHEARPVGRLRLV